MKKITKRVPIVKNIFLYGFNKKNNNKEYIKNNSKGALSPEINMMKKIIQKAIKNIFFFKMSLMFK